LSFLGDHPGNSKLLADWHSWLIPLAPPER
jgi:hypothetical protein